MSVHIVGAQSSYGFICDQEWSEGNGTYECRVLICPDEEEGGFTAHAIRLPGVVSEGETVDEAMANIADAFQAAIQAYLAQGEIPWCDVGAERTKGSFERWILVNA